MSLSTAAALGEEMRVKSPSGSSQEKGEDEVVVLAAESPVAASEFNDPAILAAKPATFKYARDDLLALRQAPLSQKRPNFLDPAYDNPSGIWDPERWHYDRKRCETPSEASGRSEAAPEAHKRRSADPRERLRKEQDGIVLSPQRRSFNSGCFVPFKEPGRGANRPHSPLGKSEMAAHVSAHREVPAGSRRIGSGRILTRDVPWDYQEKSDVDEFGYRRERREAPDRDDRYEKRGFSRDFDITRDKEKDRHVGRSGNGRFERRRVNNNDRDDEPEWFSGGPVSQNDTIELRGFEDGEDKGSAAKKKPSPPQKKKNRDKKSDDAQAADESQKAQESREETRAAFAEEKPHNVVDLDDIFKLDSIPGLLMNGSNDEGGDGAVESRFSRWFKRESPARRPDDSQRSSLEDERLIKNLLNDISAEPNITIPADSDSYFAPISPAASTTSSSISRMASHAGLSQKPLNIVEMLQRGKQIESGHGKSEVPGKVMSLEELEARMLRQGGGDPGTARVASYAKQPVQKIDENMEAFQKLLAQVSGGFAVPASTNGPMQPKQQPPMSILEMLSQSQQQDEAARLSAALSPNPGHFVPSADLALKLQQMQQQQQKQHAQMELLSKLINANTNQHRQQFAPSPLLDLSGQQNRDLLARPEAQAILQGLKRGDITAQHLYQQLAANPAMQPRHRELLLTILKLHGNVGPSPRVLSPVAPPSLFQPPSQQPPGQQQAQQQLRVSPLPGSALHQRIPSPRELQVHTQNIMQRALIKKKLEEQQENYKKRQEMQLQRGGAPNSGGVSPAKHMSSPTPLAFTPTSVLRKMTADKDDVSKEAAKNAALEMHCKVPPGRALTGMKMPGAQMPPQQQWGLQQPQPKQPAGRAIVKANANLQSALHEAQQPQWSLQQQQRLYGGQPQQQQQQPRKISSQYSGNMPHSSVPSNFPFPTSNQQHHLTQQQLRAQHQQQQPPQPPPQQQYNRRSLQSWPQQMMPHHTYDNRMPSQMMMGRGGVYDGDLSPTSNQLARWFSPDLLERARAGKLPDMPSANLAQHAISLEEIERKAAPPVHN